MKVGEKYIYFYSNNRLKNIQAKSVEEFITNALYMSGCSMLDPAMVEAALFTKGIYSLTKNSWLMYTLEPIEASSSYPMKKDDFFMG